MRVLKRIVCIFLAILVISLPVIIPVSAIFIVPPQYDNTFVGALSDKVERLKSVEGEKIVIVGGSSVAFGIDSELIEEKSGMPVVNFGLYAAIGTRAMLELSREHIGEGDIVVVAPEMDPQTLSMYFSADFMLKSMDSDYSLALGLSSDSRKALLRGLWNHAADKLSASLEEKADPEGVYNSRNFNEKGDILWERRENVMPFYYDPNNRISLTPEIVDPEFVDFLNEYTEYCEGVGAKVYFSFPPMNERALAKGTTEESIYAFEDYLYSVLECEIVSMASTYIMDAGYFYDTNYHLNETGVTYRTRRLIEDVFLILCEDGPEPPKLPTFDPIYDGEYDENAEYFLFEELSDGGMAIVGLTEKGRSAAELTVPKGYGGRKVTTIEERALEGGVARKLTVSSDTNLRLFRTGFNYGSSITDIWIYYNYTESEDALTPAADFGGVYIHVPSNSAYLNDYSWLDSAEGFEFVTDID